MSNLILMSLIGLGIVTSFSFIYSVKKEFYIVDYSEIQEIFGSENMTSKTFDYDSFSEINVHDQIKVIYTTGPYSVTAEAEDNIMDLIRIRKIGKGLDIVLDNEQKQIRNHRPITIEVQAPKLSEINLNEQSEFYFRDKLVQNSLIVNLDHQANFNGVLELKTLVINTEDQSRMTVEGSAESLSLDCENQSSFMGKDFKSDRINISLTEQSSASISSDGKIEGSIRNTASLDIIGNADVSNLIVGDQAKINQ